jgi:tetratricopeptide (TPR) repeat protein
MRQKLILMAMIVIIALVASAWLYGIRDLEALSGYLLTLIQIIIVILILILLGLFFWTSSNIEYSVVLPFTNATGYNKYDGKAISDSLVAEFQNIREVHDRKIDKRPSLRLPLRETTPSGEILSNVFNKLQADSQDLANNLMNVGTINLGIVTLSIGPLLIYINKIIPKRNNRFIISGSLQKYGAKFRLVAQIDYSGTITTKETSREIDKDDDIPELIKDLSYIIAHHISNFSEKNIKAKSWKSFRLFTEALDNYHNFILTNKDKDLENAGISCIEAIESEPDYSNLFALFYNLGIAYFDRQNYSKSEEMFRYASNLAKHPGVLLDPLHPNSEGHAGAFSGLSASLRYLHRYGESIEASTCAMDVDAKLASPWTNIGNVYLDLSAYAGGLYDKAIEAYKNAIKLDPDFANPNLGIGLVMYRKRDYENAVGYFKKASDLGSKPGYKFGWDEVASQLSIAGCYLRLKEKDKKYKDDFDNLINDIRKKKDTLSNYNRACFESIYGDEGIACDFLDKALVNEDIYPSEVHYDPDFEPIHNSSRFKDLMANHSEKKEIFENIRKFLLKENIYSRASFEAAYGDIDEAMKFLEDALRNNLISIREVYSDPHFERMVEREVFKKLMEEYSK